MKKSLGAKTILYPAPVLLVGTYDAAGRANIMTCSWGGICCSEPPSLAVSLREATYSYGSIVQTRAFTVNVPSAGQVKAADHAGLVSGRDTDKFASLGLTATHAEHVEAPYVEECPLVVECRLSHTLKLGLHTLFVGEVMDVKADAMLVDEAGRIDLGQLRPFAFDPVSQRYHALGADLGPAFSIGRETGG